MIQKENFIHRRNQGAGAPVHRLVATKRGEGCVTRLSITIIGFEYDG